MLTTMIFKENTPVLQSTRTRKLCKCFRIYLDFFEWAAFTAISHC